MLKTNSKKILTWLYSDTEKIAFLKRKNVNLIVDNLSKEGLRSLLYHLTRQGLIEEQLLGGEIGYYITRRGKRVIEEEMRVLSPKWGQWDGSWLLITIIESSREGQDIQKLRRVLRESGALAFNRGMYLWPGCFGDELRNEVLSDYVEFVWVWEIKDLPDENTNKKITEKMAIKACIENYSAVSSEIDNLLDKNQPKKRLTESAIVQKFRIYDRLFFVGVEDGGLVSFFLKKLQKSTNNEFDFKCLLNRLQDKT